MLALKQASECGGLCIRMRTALHTVLAAASLGRSRPSLQMSGELVTLLYVMRLGNSNALLVAFDEAPSLP